MQRYSQIVISCKGAELGHMLPLNISSIDMRSFDIPVHNVFISMTGASAAYLSTPEAKCT